MGTLDNQNNNEFVIILLNFNLNVFVRGSQWRRESNRAV